MLDNVRIAFSVKMFLEPASEITRHANVERSPPVGEDIDPEGHGHEPKLKLSVRSRQEDNYFPANVLYESRSLLRTAGFLGGNVLNLKMCQNAASPSFQPIFFPSS